MKRYPDGGDGKFFFQKDAPKHMPDWIPTRAFEVTTREKPRAEADDPRAARQRRARAALDGEHGLHRPEHVVLAGRQAATGRTSCSSTSIRRRTSGFPEVVAGRAARQGGARRARARRLPEDERRATGCTCSCPSSGGTPTRTRASSRRSSRGRSRATHRGLVDDRVDEGEAARRPDRLEPERRGEDDRVGLLGAAAAGRAGFDAARAGTRSTTASTRARSRWRSCSPASSGTATCSRAC